MSTSPDGPAVEALWNASSRRLQAWFERRTGSPHDADDLVQETFLRAQARLDTLRDGDHLAAWLGVIARNVLADHARARGRRTVPLEDGDQAPPSPRGQERGGGDGDLAAAVAGWIEPFLAQLDAVDAGILRAVHLEGRAQVDVARELGLSASGARSRVQRARARLRRQLERCCRFAFDARGNLTEARRRPEASCDCDPGRRDPEPGNVGP